MRFEIWIEEWEQASRDPVVEQGFFDDLVRQTMAVDLSALMEPAPPWKQRAKRETRQEGSIVAEVEKEVVLAMVDQMEAEAVQKELLAHLKGSALLCAHDENVSAWIEADFPVVADSRRRSGAVCSAMSGSEDAAN